jgi:hypothetical protein
MAAKRSVDVLSPHESRVTEQAAGGARSPARPQLDLFRPRSILVAGVLIKQLGGDRGKNNGVTVHRIEPNVPWQTAKAA